MSESFYVMLEAGLEYFTLCVVFAIALIIGRDAMP